MKGVEMRIEEARLREQRKRSEKKGELIFLRLLEQEMAFLKGVKTMGGADMPKRRRLKRSQSRAPFHRVIEEPEVINTMGEMFNTLAQAVGTDHTFGMSIEVRPKEDLVEMTVFCQDCHSEDAAWKVRLPGVRTRTKEDAADAMQDAIKRIGFAIEMTHSDVQAGLQGAIFAQWVTETLASWGAITPQKFMQLAQKQGLPFAPEKLLEQAARLGLVAVPKGAAEPVMKLPKDHPMAGHPDMVPRNVPWPKHAAQPDTGMPF